MLTKVYTVYKNVNNNTIELALNWHNTNVLPKQKAI